MVSHQTINEGTYLFVAGGPENGGEHRPRMRSSVRGGGGPAPRWWVMSGPGRLRGPWSRGIGGHEAAVTEATEATPAPSAAPGRPLQAFPKQEPRVVGARRREAGGASPLSRSSRHTCCLSVGLHPEPRGRKVQKEGKISYADFVWFLISEEDKKTPTRYVLGGCPGAAVGGRGLAAVPEHERHQGSVQARPVPGRVHTGQGWPGWRPPRVQ